MKNKKYLILVLILVLITILIFVVIKKLFLSNNIILATTTEEERNFWNDFLNNSPYIGETTIYIHQRRTLGNETDILKIALATDEVKTEYINEQEIRKNPLLTEGEGYKKSKKEIDKYLKELLDIELFPYDSIEKYNSKGAYLIESEDYIYFTKIKVPQKIYIATRYELEDENYTLEVYEYLVTEENNSKLEEMLKTGEISSKVQKNNSYIIIGTKTEDIITIKYKYASKEDIKELDELVNRIPDTFVPAD